MMQKNEIVKVKIEDIGVGGEGIGKVDGYTLFIKDAIIGDVVEAKVMKAKKNYGYARLMNVLTPSKDRVEEPVCPMARKCGGCQIQEMKYPAQLAFKEAKVRGNLERIGEVPTELLDQIMHPAVGMDGEGMQPFRYRNKAQFPIGTDKDGRVIAGFYAGRTHSIIENTDCALGVEVNEEILNCILDFMEEFKIPAYDEVKHKGLVRHVLLRYGFKTDEIMVCLVINGKTIPHCHDLVGRLRQIPGMTSITLSTNTAKTNVIMGDTIRLLWGQEFITDYIGEIKYQISPLSFYQVNPVQTEKLYGLALDYAGLTGNETVWDLYCGIGTISLFLAKKAKQVYGVEIVQKSQADAYQNLAAFDGKKVAAQKGTVQENIVKDQVKGANLVSLTKNGQMINELKNGTVSGVVFEEPIAKAYVAANPDLAIVTNIKFDSSKSDSYAIAMPKDSGNLKKEIDKVITQLKADGKIEEFVKTNFELSQAAAK